MINPALVRIGAPIAALLLGVVLQQLGLTYAISVTLAITLWIAIWWISEALPIPATSILPFVLFPLFGIITHKQAAAALGSHVIILLMGGFMIAKGIEKSGLHRRMAMSMLKALAGKGGRWLVFAFMLVGATLSMWISNTATCLILLPIALAVLQQVEDKKLKVAVILGVAFSCNLGGIATLMGTPPNLIFAGIYEELTQQEFSFAQWSKIGFPLVILGLPLMALWLGRGVNSVVKVTLPETTPWRTEEKRVLWIFLLIVFLWVFRLEPFGGWSTWLNIPNAGDSTVALLGVALMFIVPSGKPLSEPSESAKKDYLLNWQTAVDIPWGMLILFAGGITLATAFQASGTSVWLGEKLSAFTDLPPFILILVICLAVTFLTEITSNTATTTLLMPVLGATAIASGIAPEIMMIPASISASCAFMLPVATAPNAIAFATEQFSMKDMLKEGLFLNIIMAILISSICYWQLV